MFPGLLSCMNVFATVHLSKDLFSYPYQNRLTLPSERKCLVSQAAAGTSMRGVKGGLIKGFTNNNFAFQKSQYKITVIIDLWSQPPVCSYKFPWKASYRWAWVHWSSYIKRLKNEVLKSFSKHCMSLDCPSETDLHQRLSEILSSLFQFYSERIP